MAYGGIKFDNITFTNAGVDANTTVSGIYKAITSGVTVTGTISGNLVQGATVSGTTVTGTSANFASGVFTTQISGTIGIFGAGSATAPGLAVGVGTTYAPGIYSPGTDQLAISTGGNERLRITAAGNVGIGTSSPASTLDVNGNISFPSSGIVGSSNLNLTTDTTQQYYFGLFRVNSTARFNGMKVYNNANGNAGTPASRIGFYLDKSGNISSTERLTITEDGFVSIGATSPNTSGAKLQTSDGLTFPATQVASSDPNTLDDYEEGTWTPTVVGTSSAGTATYSSQSGTYVKIGKMVTVNALLVYSSGTGTGNLQIAGLPFTVNNTLQFGFGSLAMQDITTPALSQVTVFANPSTSNLNI